MIPTAVLRDRVRIDPFLGVDGMGADVFGTPLLRVPARLVESKRQVRTGTGVDVVTVPQCQLRPGVDIAPQSRITLGDESWTVVDVQRARDLGRTHGQLLTLDGPRQAVVQAPSQPVVEDVVLDGGAP